MSDIEPIKVGDVFYRSWGYDQTNVNFYQVVGLTPSGKSVRLIEVGKRIVEGGVIPRNVTEGDVFVKRLQEISGLWATAFNSYSSLYQWDGKPKYDTCAMGGAGH